MKLARRWYVFPIVVVAVVFLAAVLVGSGRKHSILAARTNLLIASQRYPKFTLAQRMAVLREWQSERHPKWRDLSFTDIARHLVALATSSSSPSQPATAPFLGNLTVIAVPAGDAVGMRRNVNCTLTMGGASYALNVPTVTYDISNLTSGYDQVLHNEAGLTTTGGNWPAGCGDPTIGITARAESPVGATTTNLVGFAAAAYYAPGDAQDIYTFMTNSLTGNNFSMGPTNISGASPVAIAVGDFNGDGNDDLAAINESATTGGTASVAVMLGNADGSFQTPVIYTLPETTGQSLVVDDFTGDGKLDIVATSFSFATGGGQNAYSLSFLGGNGDGTFKGPQSTSLTLPSGLTTNPYYGLISADLLGNGKKDLVTSGGVVFMGNQDGTFTQSSTLAFPASLTTSSSGTNVVAGDFNKDGKIDLAVDDGQSIAIYLGNGNGTFRAGDGYATIANVGYLNVNDLDGDGNVDLYSGIARGGLFGGDEFEPGQAYALMGKGDGTFSGAPYLPFVFTGTNLADLNGDKVLDGVGVNATLNSNNVSFTSYLGNGDGTFKTGSTLQISPITVSGNPVSFQTLDSFGLGDTRGNGNVDLVYLPQSFYWPGGVTGFLLATGNGDGSFNAPVFVQAPSFAPSGDFDQFEDLSNLFVTDVNGDGKADLVYSYSVGVYQTSTYEQGIAVQLSNGDGTFQAPQVIQTYSSTTAPTAAPPALVQLGDATGNGKLDLFTETYNSSTAKATLQLYLGNGDGTFGSALTPTVADNIGLPSFGSVLGQIVLADMNGDGKPDLITLGSTNNNDYGELAISLGNGDGTFKPPTIVDFGFGSSLGYGLAAADFNGDGKMDVAVNGFNPPFDTGIFLGNGDGTVQSFSSSGGSAQPSEAVYLFSYGPAIPMQFSGSKLPGLIAGEMVLTPSSSNTSTLTGTTTNLTASAATVNAGASVTFIATVTPASGSGTPTGSITFMDGTTTLGTVSLSSGAASYPTSSLAVGAHSITAVYGGDSNYSGSSSSAVPVTVQALPPSFTLGASPTSGSVKAGSSAQATLTVTPVNGFNSQVSFACSGQSNGVTCSFSPATVTPSGSATMTTLTIATTSQSAQLARPASGVLRRGSRGPVFLALLAAGAFWLTRRRKALRWPWMIVISLLTIAAVSGGCGGSGASSNSSGSGTGSQPQSANYTITVTATAGSESHTASYALTVTQ